MVDLEAQYRALEQVLQSYGDYEKCDRWNRESASISEDGVLAALERVPVDAERKLGSVGGRASVTKGQLVRAAILSGHARALRRLLEMGCSPNGEGALVIASNRPVLDVTDHLNAEDARASGSEDIAGALNERAAKEGRSFSFVNGQSVPVVGNDTGNLMLDMTARLNAAIAANPRGVKDGAEADVMRQFTEEASRNAGPFAPATSLSDEQPLVEAVYQLALSCVKVLLEFGADPNGGPARRAKPLVACARLVHRTAQDEAVAVSKLLLDAGVDIDGLDKNVSATAGAHCARAGCDGVLAAVVEGGADLELAVCDGLRRGNDQRYTPLQFAAGGLTGAIQLGGATEDTVRVLVRRGAKLEPATAPPGWPEVVLRRGRRNPLADLTRYIIDNGGDAAEPNSRATPEALAKRVALVDDFERLSAAFSINDKVVLESLKAKPKYNGKTAIVRGRCNGKGRYPATVEMRDGPETIDLKVANLRVADE